MAYLLYPLTLAVVDFQIEVAFLAVVVDLELISEDRYQREVERALAAAADSVVRLMRVVRLNKILYASQKSVLDLSVHLPRSLVVDDEPVHDAKTKLDCLIDHLDDAFLDL